MPSPPVFNSNNPVDTYLLNLRTDESLRTQRSKLRSFIKLAGGSSIEDFDWSTVNHNTIRYVIKRMRDEGRKSSTVNATLSAVKGVFLELYNNKKVNVEEYTRVKNLKGGAVNDNEIGRALSKSEIKRMIHIPVKRPIDSRDNAILSVMFGCGLRRVEVTRLQMDNFYRDVTTPFLRIHGKGNKYRDVYLPGFALKALTEWVDDYRGFEPGEIFLNILRNDSVGESPISAQRVYYIVKTRVVNASPHDIRRTFITRLLENGVDLITTQTLAGHANPATTAKYDKRGDAQQISAIKSLENI